MTALGHVDGSGMVMPPAMFLQHGGAGGLGMPVAAAAPKGRVGVAGQRAPGIALRYQNESLNSSFVHFMNSWQTWQAHFNAAGAQKHTKPPQVPPKTLSKELVQKQQKQQPAVGPTSTPAPTATARATPTPLPDTHQLAA